MSLGVDCNYKLMTKLSYVSVFILEIIRETFSFQNSLNMAYTFLASLRLQRFQNMFRTPDLGIRWFRNYCHIALKYVYFMSLLFMVCVILLYLLYVFLSEVLMTIREKQKSSEVLHIFSHLLSLLRIAVVNNKRGHKP